MRQAPVDIKYVAKTVGRFSLTKLSSQSLYIYIHTYMQIILTIKNLFWVYFDFLLDMR